MGPALAATPINRATRYESHEIEAFLSAAARCPALWGRGATFATLSEARKNRWGHRDATMILVAYRHGFRCLSVPVGTPAVNALVRGERQIARVSGLFRFLWDNQVLATVLHFSGYIVPPVTDAWSTYDAHNSAIGIA
jgi:hypothetical protein